MTKAYLEKTDASSKPLEWILDIKHHEACQSCDNQTTAPKIADRIELETDLLGIRRRLTKDPSQKYQKNPKIANTLPYTNP